MVGSLLRAQVLQMLHSLYLKLITVPYILKEKFVALLIYLSLKATLTMTISICRTLSSIQSDTRLIPQRCVTGETLGP